MKRCIARLGLVLALAARDARGQALAGRDRFEKHWPFAADGSVRIVNPAGGIRVIGANTDSLAGSCRGPGSVAAAGAANVRTHIGTCRTELEKRVPRAARVCVE